MTKTNQEPACYGALKYQHILLLLAYKSERSKAQAYRAITHEDERIDMGRHVLPFTQELVDWGLVRRTNPGAPSVKGHRHLITSKGMSALENYFERLNNIAHLKPNYGF